MTKVEYEAQMPIALEAAAANDTQALSAVLANEDLTQEQRWMLLVLVVDDLQLSEEDNSDNEDYRNFLKLSVEKNNVEIVETLFSTPGLTADNKYALLMRLVDEDQDENTIVTIAIRNFYTDMVRLLIEQTQTLPDDRRFELLKDIINEMNQDSDSCLIGEGHEDDDKERRQIKSWNDMLQIVFQSCSDLTSEQKIEGLYNNYSDSPHAALIIAARYNDAESINTIISSLDLTPIDAIELLTSCTDEEGGAGDTVLMAAVRNGHIPVVEVLFNLPFMSLEQRSKMIGSKNKKGETALNVAVQYKNTILLNKILFNFDMNQPLIFNEAALESVQALIIEAVRNNSNIDFDIIISNQFLAQVQKSDLIQIENINGETALSIAIKNEHVVLLDKMLSGLDIDEEFNLCSIALKMAEEENKNEIIKILQAKLELNYYKKQLMIPDLTPLNLYKLLTQINDREQTIFIQVVNNNDIKTTESILEKMQILSDEQKCKILNSNFMESVLSIKIERSILRMLLKSCSNLFLNQDFHYYTQAFKKALIIVSSDNDVESCKFILKDLGLSPENIMLTLSQKYENIGIEKLVGHTALTAAVSNECIEVIKLILQTVPVRNRFILLNQEVANQTVLMLAPKNCETYNFLNEQVLYCLNKRNKHGQTLLIASASRRDMEVMYYILNSINILKISEEMNLNYLKNIFQQSDNFGKTAIMYSIENGHTQLTDILLQVLRHALVGILFSPDLSVTKKTTYFKEILTTISIDTKFNLLAFECRQGMTLFMFAVEYNNLAIAQEMLSHLNLDQVSSLLNIRNTQGHTALGIAKEHRFQALVGYLENLSLRLAFNTHSATVHDSVARSVIALSEYYLALSQEDKAVLKSWSDSVPGDENDVSKTQAMLEVIHKNETQLGFATLIQDCEADLAIWVSQLNTSTEHMQKAAARGLILIKDNLAYRNYFEPKIKVSVMQILALTWIAIHDQRECEPTLDFAAQINDKKIALIDALFQAQRDRNLTNGQDLDPLSADQPKCQGGFINNLINTLIGLHSQVKVVVVNRETVKLKAMCLVGDLFNSSDYTGEQVQEIQHTLEEDACLTKYVQANLEPKIEGALHTEFDEFVETKFLNAQDIPSITRAVLMFQSPNSYMAVQAIQAKLEADLRVHAKPELQPDDENCEQENKRSRLR